MHSGFFILESEPILLDIRKWLRKKENWIWQKGVSCELWLDIKDVSRKW